MKLIDISMPVHADMMVYKNKEEKRPILHQSTSGHSTETMLTMNLHTGTHVDAPLHMMPGGGTIDSTYTLDTFWGRAFVVDLSHLEEKVDAPAVEGLDLDGVDWLLLKTRNSSETVFDFTFVYLEKEAAQILAHRGLKGVGIDGLGIERAQEGHPTHKILLSEGVCILEGLRLEHVAEGYYDFFALPIAIDNVEAAPVRAVLIEG